MLGERDGGVNYRVWHTAGIQKILTPFLHPASPSPLTRKYVWSERLKEKTRASAESCFIVLILDRAPRNPQPITRGGVYEPPQLSAGCCLGPLLPAQPPGLRPSGRERGLEAGVKHFGKRGHRTQRQRPRQPRQFRGVWRPPLILSLAGVCH